MVETSTAPLHVSDKSVVIDEIQPEGLKKIELVEDEDKYVKDLIAGKFKPYQLESMFRSNLERAINIRRQYFCHQSQHRDSIESLPYKNVDYSIITESCCNNVIGYVPVPLGYAGPLIVDNVPHFVPLATTEGALIASINRGCRAISISGGCKTILLRDTMTRAPVIEFDDIEECYKFQEWIEKMDHFRLIKQKFDSTSRFVSLKSVEPSVWGEYVFLRFKASTGDAMGMNMVSKAAEATLNYLKTTYFAHTSMRIISLSGNYCIDKKSGAVNSISGRGKKIVAQCTIPSKVVADVLKTSVSSLVHLNYVKNHIGSEISGSVGGFNAQAANIVTAIFIACGQLLGCAGGNVENPGENARHLARVICSTVVAGELSLLAALNEQVLVKSHMKYNRSQANLSHVLTERSAASTAICRNAVSATTLTSLASKASAASHPETCSKVLT
uniref:3-hydroxy-3-methylglutaryl-coenzyme A reductase n=1 Tax=Romanomermis culicivorax TaxID=13658 RepID=A0A915J8W5_ROMCU